MTHLFERHLPTALVLLMVVALVLSFSNREEPQAAVPSEMELGAIPAIVADQGDFGLKPLIVPASPEVINEDTAKEARSRMLWPIDIGGPPALSRILPETSSDPSPDIATADGLHVAVIFSGKLSIDTYGRENRERLHVKLREFAKIYGYDVVIDADGARGSAYRAVYQASNKVDRTAAFENFLYGYENMTSASP